MAEKKTFTDAKFVHGDLTERTVFDRYERAVFAYNPEEWQLDVVRTRGGNNGTVVASYKFIAEQGANFLSQADDRDEYVNVVLSKDK